MKILATIQKELLLLIRDPGGMALLFLMPVALVIVMALIQDAPFRDYEEIKLEVLFVDSDSDSLGPKLSSAFAASPNVLLIPNKDSVHVKELVHSGRFKAAILLSPGASAVLRGKARHLIDEVLFNAGVTTKKPEAETRHTTHVRLLYDPAIKPNYKQVLASATDRMLTSVQAEWVVDELQNQLGNNKKVMEKVRMDFSGLTSIDENFASTNNNPKGLNSVQHNVPAWTMFAMFFILFPLAGNYIKEREEGSLLRLRLIAGSQFPVITGKFAFYFCVCLVQFILMMGVGVVVMPWVGLQSLSLGNNITGILLTACAVAIAATGFGTLIAVYFKTPQQALSFGSISVVILSALGGVWVPVYVMPTILQKISGLSPLNWGLESFNDLFLRDAETSVILGNLLKLVVFGLVTLTSGIFIHKSRTVS